MDEVPYTLVLVSLTLLYVSYHLFHRMRNDELREIRGPASPSWIFGNMLQLTLTPTYGEYEFEWLKKYGSVYRFKGCFGEDRLMISDPAALHTLLSREQFALGPGMGNGGRLIYNAGCTWLTDSEKDHQRLRAAFNEGFTVAAVRSYIPIFERVAQTLTEQFDEIASHSVGDISPLLGQATLASVAEAILGLSLNDLGDEFISTNLQLINVASNQSATQVLADALLRWIPNAICDLMLYIPVQPFSFVYRAKVLTDEIGKRVIRSSKIAKSKGLEGIGGFYDALVDKAQTYSSDGNNAFSERDILDQTTLLLLAGQDTTANTLVFGFLELARDVDLQERLRAEIHFYYASRLGTRDANTFDNMPLLNAFIKETLRLYPAVALSDRVATEDVVLPLSEPIITSRGKQLTQIPIPKGQIVYIGTAEYQRSESIWGPDAHEFKTSRWLKDDGPLKGEGVSSYANLLSFFGGTRICLGWRFALLEMQIFVCELVTKFEFSLPDEVHLRTTCQYAMTLQPMLPDGKKGAFLAIKRVT